MSHILHEKYDMPVYSLVCISTSGEYTPQAWVNMANAPEPIKVGDRNVEKQLPYTCFLDLRKLGARTQATEFSMTPVLHKTTFTTNWRAVFDGIVFIADQQALQPVK